MGQESDQGMPQRLLAEEQDLDATLDSFQYDRYQRDECMFLPPVDF